MRATLGSEDVYHCNAPRPAWFLHLGPIAHIAPPDAAKVHNGIIQNRSLSYNKKTRFFLPYFAPRREQGKPTRDQAARSSFRLRGMERAV